MVTTVYEENDVQEILLKLCVRMSCMLCDVKETLLHIQALIYN